jgi:tRNA pseudouridine38-40 synthase
VRWRIRFGYDGTGFQGWARQPGVRTVEGELLRGMKRVGLVPRTAAHLEVASRTDRGVSARANALALTSELAPRTLLRALNGIAPEVWWTAAAPLAETARIRGALRRTYRYYEPGPFREPAHRARAAEQFAGRVDVRSFGRGLPSEGPVWREVESVTLRPLGPGEVVEVVAPSFVWGMVRKIVGALREVDAGRLPLAHLESALAGRVRLTLPMAAPEPLVLWEVEYPDPWTDFWTGPNPSQARWASGQREGLWARTQVLGALSDGGLGPSPD